MSNCPKTSAKTEQGEYGNFENLLRRVVSVPHSKLKERLQAEKKQKRTSKHSASRASSEKD
jgi:hypothetical protein